MVESSDKPNLLDRIRSSARKAYASYTPTKAGNKHPVLLTNEPIRNNAEERAESAITNPIDVIENSITAADITGDYINDKISSVLPPPAPPPHEDGGEEGSATLEPKQKSNIVFRSYENFKEILFSSWLNVLLVFIPVGIAVKVAGVNPSIVFATNAIAIIPLAGLLSHATESVASELGDTIGALMNITFGNAVELIIFIALVKNEIRIVQASLLGSILANLLLILGMCFLFGGLRFREQIYNSTVTQMSACLLSLSVMSLLLPTAFHASFTDNAIADKAVIKVSRGTSIILLFVYILYLLFQLKSHAYMYQSTPQHVIDEESHPGVLADMLGSSTSSSSPSSSGESDSDSDRSSGSNTTAKRIRRVLRGRRRRKSSASSKDTPSVPSTARTPSASTFNNIFDRSDFTGIDFSYEKPSGSIPRPGVIASGDEADTDGEREHHLPSNRDPTINFRDFENEKGNSGSKSPEVKLKERRSKRKHRKYSHHIAEQVEVSEISAAVAVRETDTIDAGPVAPHVDFVENVKIVPESSPKRPFNIRGLSVRGAMPVLPALPMPTIPRMLSSTVFSATNPTGLSTSGRSATFRSLRRTKSLTALDDTDPGLLTQPLSQQLYTDPSHPLADSADGRDLKKHMSRTAAILLLLISTGLVAVCAEFLVDSINYLVDNTSVSEAFVGLIILPIVGNAAEHVTAVTVASKNKMDLAIGVAVGSSIQIALFVTPVIVLLGWILAKDMSLYFSLFETVSLFVSAFIVNFLVLDGRSNYLEGALLIAAYVIIAVAAFFYPDSGEQSTLGGGEHAERIFRMS